MNAIDHIKTLKVGENTYTLELRKYERVTYNKKDSRGKAHKFAWCLYVCTDNFDDVETPKYRIHFKSRKDALKIESLIHSQLKQGISFNTVYYWAFNWENKWFWKKTLSKDYVDIEWFPCDVPSRWEVINSKWYFYKHKKDDLSESLYACATSLNEWRDKEYDDYDKCVNTIALLELGADLFYKSENGDTPYEALLRANNRFFNNVILGKQIVVPIPEGKEQEYEEYFDTIKKNYQERKTPPTWASELH